MILISFTCIFAQEDYELGVILLQVRQPEVVSFSNGQVINGSPQLQAVFQQYPATGSRKLSHISVETDGWYRIEFAVTFPLGSIRTALSACPDIKHVTLNYYGILSGTPNDPLWTSQWALQKIQMPNAWDVTKPSSTILVGIMDTGLDYTHVDLADNIWANPNEIAGNGIDDDGNGRIDDIRGWDFVFNDNNPQEGGLTHGTRVAGVIAARTYNGIGVAGIAGGWQSQVGVRLVGLRIGNDLGTWNQVSARDAINYLTWFRQQYGYTVIANMSIQSDFTDADLIAFRQAVDAARDAGVIMLAAAGNVQATGPYNHPDVDFLPAPARWLGVLAIGASKDGTALQNEKRSSYSLYDIEGAKLLVVAPVDTHVTTGINVYTTLPGNSYINTFHGTSAACPMAVGVIALMLTLNPTLTYQQISDILAATGEKIGNYSYGLGGRALEVGYGRINAYQALLLTHAYSNKSIDSDATAHNSGRRLVRDSSGNYHLVFGSGGEIFYRKYSGGAWQTPQRLSSGNGSNKYPSITERGGKVYVTWQRKNGSTHDIYFHKSTDGGLNWLASNRITVKTSVGSPDPLQVIISPSTSNLVVMYRSSTNLQSRHSSDDGVSWYTETFGQFCCTLSSPSLALVKKVAWGSADTPALVYASTDRHVYYRYYDPAIGWAGQTQLSAVVPGTTQTHQTPSISGEGTGSTILHVAWHETSGSGATQNTIIYRKSSAYNSWPSQYTRIYYQEQQRPTITAFGTNSVDIVFQQKNFQTIYRQHYNGSTWSGPILIGNGQYSSISTGSTSAKYVWTSAGSAPFTINLSSETLSKETSGEPYYERAISWLDSSGAHLTVRVKGWSVKTASGQQQSLTFLPVSLDTVAQFTPSNSWDYLASLPALLSANAESLLVDFTLWAENLQKVGTASGGPQISLEFKNSTGLSLSKISGPAFSASGTIPETAFRFAVPLDAVKQWITTTVLQAVVKVEGFPPKSETFASLGHIYDFTKQVNKGRLDQPDHTPDQVPDQFVLYANYPNPFNPETIIKYQLPELLPVTLKIYNLLGQEIRTLVDEVQRSGVYEIRWDGKDDIGRSVASGIYVYRLQAGSTVAVKKMIMLQ
jgi:hypothetical protein